MAQLIGTGDHAAPQNQAGLRGRVIAASSNCARNAFMKVGKFEKKRVPYTKVIQRFNEPYQDFLERLQRALEMADIPEEVKPILMKELARIQANDQTRQILSQLPAKASIADMIK